MFIFETKIYIKPMKRFDTIPLDLASLKACSSLHLILIFFLKIILSKFYFYCILAIFSLTSLGVHKMKNKKKIDFFN